MYKTILCAAAALQRRLGLSVVVAAGLTLPAFGQEMVKPEGIYVLNLAKSTARGRPANKSSAVSYAGDGFTAVGFGPDGKPFTVNATVIADGKPHVATTGGPFDTSTYTQIDPYTLSISRTKDGKVVETGVRVISPDGKTMWLTATGATPNGQAYSSLSVFEKQ